MIVFRALAALLLLLPAACQAGNPDVTKAASGLSVVRSTSALRGEKPTLSRLKSRGLRANRPAG